MCCEDTSLHTADGDAFLDILLVSKFVELIIELFIKSTGRDLHQLYRYSFPVIVHSPPI